MGPSLDLAVFDSLDVARYRLADGDSIIALRNPVDLLEPRLAPWREAIASVSSAAFGTDMSGIWAERFAGEFLALLFRWVLVFDAHDNLVGSAGYRATTMLGQRLVYWESTSVLPGHRGHGVVVQLQLKALALESEKSQLPVQYLFRTRSPVALWTILRRFKEQVTPNLDGRVPVDQHGLFAAAADWLGFAGLNPATGRIYKTYEGRPPLYAIGEEPVSSNAEVNAFMATLGPTDGLMVMVGPDAHLM